MTDDTRATGLLCSTSNSRETALTVAGAQGGVVDEGTFRINVDRTIENTLRLAEAYEAWLDRPRPVVRLVAVVGPLVPISKGNTMTDTDLQLPTTYEFTITLDPEDQQGNTLPDTLAWTSTDPTNAPVSADTTTLVGTVQLLNPTTGVVVTATDGTNTYTYPTFDVVADAVVDLAATVGALTKIGSPITATVSPLTPIAAETPAA